MAKLPHGSRTLTIGVTHITSDIPNLGSSRFTLIIDRSAGSPSYYIDASNLPSDVRAYLIEWLTAETEKEMLMTEHG